MNNIVKFLVVSLLLYSLAYNSYSCGDCRTHNYYMIKFCDNDTYSKRINNNIRDFYLRYTSGRFGDYNYYSKEIAEIAKQKNDREMVSYLACLDDYLSICSSYAETWDYPSRETIENRQSKTLALLERAKKHDKGALKAQYLLLRMRCNMLLNNDFDNVEYWEKKASKLPESFFKQMMNNIYAGALYRCGKKEQALQIFAKQGDYNSIGFLFRNSRNANAIVQVYRNDCNSLGLSYLLQDFVNNAQERFDNRALEDKTLLESCESDIETLLSLADKATNNSNLEDPAMWYVVKSMLYYLKGQKDFAIREIDKAMMAKGTKTSKDNARALRLLIYTCTRENLDKEFVLKELKWLDSKAEKEKDKAIYFLNVKDRIVDQELKPYFKSHSFNLYIALNELSDKLSYKRNVLLYSQGESGPYSLNYSAYSEYFSVLDSLSAEQTEAYVKFIKAGEKDGLEQYITSGSLYEENFFNDLIGTKYLSQGRFDKALVYLDKVPLSFVNTQAISYYMAKRDFEKEAWFVRQYVPEDWEQMEKKRTLKSNPKIEFCKRMIELDKRFTRQTDLSEKQSTAYEIATIVFQASYYGQCWFLSDYSYSVYRLKNKPFQSDFVALCRKYLQFAAQSKDKKMRAKCLYALASICKEPWAEREYDILTGKEKIVRVNLFSKQYKALDDLYVFLSKNPSLQEDYRRKCDVYREFVKHTVN